MFSMTSLESHNSPLRTLQTFYQPKNRPHSRSAKKTFPNIARNSEIEQLYNPKPNRAKKQISIKKYIDTLERNKNLQRRQKNRGQIDAFISFSRQKNPQSQDKSKISRQKSLQSLKMSIFGASRAQSVCSILDKKHKDSFRNKWRQFQQKLNAREEQVKEKLRFSFYNSQEKNSKFMQKYWKEQSLNERGSSAYQNVFNRTIAQDGLKKLLGDLDKRRRKGQLV